MQGLAQGAVPASWSMQAARLVVPLASCVALDMWLCLSQLQRPLCAMEPVLPPYRAAEYCAQECQGTRALTPHGPWWPLIQAC